MAAGGDDSAEERVDFPNNVEYVLLAEFDIHSGSIVKHQYPRTCPVSAGILADLMLPEGGHLRSEDWTIFFLRDSDMDQVTDSKRQRSKTKVDKWRSMRAKMKRDLDSLVASVQVLEWSETAQDWFIFNEIALLKMVYDHSYDWSGPSVGAGAEGSGDWPMVTLEISDIESGEMIRTAIVNEDMQFTLLSEDSFFCSFYPSHGNAVGLKFLESDHLTQTRTLITHILDPPSRPKSEPSSVSAMGESDPSPADSAGSESSSISGDEAVIRQALKQGDQLVCLNVVRTDHDDSVKRGAIMKSLGLVTKLRILDSFKPLLVTALDHYFRSESETGLSFLYVTLNEAIFEYSKHAAAMSAGIPGGGPHFSQRSRSLTRGKPGGAASFSLDGTSSLSSKPVSVSPTLSAVSEKSPGPKTSSTPGPPGSSAAGARAAPGSPVLSSTPGPSSSSTGGTGTMALKSAGIFGDSGQNSETFVVPVTFHRINMNLIVPMHVGPDEITGVSVSNFLNKFLNSFPLVYNALITMKRVLFIGHNEPASLVCDCVLSACLLTSPSIQGSLKRAYPYTCLTAMDFLAVPGYIAGVTNPLFETREEWWDICCNVTTGIVRCSETYRAQLDKDAAVYGKTISRDRQLVDTLKTGITGKYGEKWLRSTIHDYTEHWTKIALNEEVFRSESEEKEDRSSNEWRINEWRKTVSYSEALDRQVDRSMQSPFKESTLEVEKIVRTMQMRVLTAIDIVGYLQRLNEVLTNEARIDYFLDLFKPSLGGLTPIVTFLFHRDSSVKLLVYQCMRIIETKSKLGKRMIQALNFYFTLAYERLKAEGLDSEVLPGSDLVGKTVTITESEIQG